MPSGFEYYFRIRIFEYSTTALCTDIRLRCCVEMGPTVLPKLDFCNVGLVGNANAAQMSFRQSFS